MKRSGCAVFFPQSLERRMWRWGGPCPSGNICSFAPARSSSVQPRRPTRRRPRSTRRSPPNMRGGASSPNLSRTVEAFAPQLRILSLGRGTEAPGRRLGIATKPARVGESGEKFGSRAYRAGRGQCQAARQPETMPRHGRRLPVETHVRPRRAARRARSRSAARKLGGDAVQVVLV